MKITRRQLRQIIKEQARRMSMSKWPGLRVTGTNASDIMDKLVSGPLRRGGEVNRVLSKLGPRMVDGRPEHSTLVFKVVNGEVSLESVSPEDDEELSSGADQLVTIFQDAKHKPGPYGENIMSDDTNVTVTLSTKKIGLNEIKITRRQLRQIILEEAVDVDVDADTDTDAAGVDRRESRRERRRARREAVQEKVRGFWNSEALQTLLDATSALGAVGSLSPGLQKAAIGTSLMSLAYSSGLGRDEGVEVNRWDLATEIAVALAALSRSGAITIPPELIGTVDSFANTAAAGAGAAILDSIGDLRGGNSLQRVVCSGGRDSMILVLQTVIDDPGSSDAQKSMAQGQIDQLNAVDATQCRQSESLSRVAKLSDLTEARMVELTPISNPVRQEESLESKWMRIAGISTDSLAEGDVVTLDAFRPPPPGEEDSYSSEFNYGSADPDLLHDRIVGDVYDDVIDQVYGKSDEERQQIFLSAIDSYVEQDDDVNMGLIDLAKVYKDLESLVDKMEMRKVSQLASERGTPEQEMEDEIEALMWQHGARPATVEESVELSRELLTKLIKEELALLLIVPEEEMSDLDVEPPDSTDAWHPSEVVPREDVWSGGDNIEDNLDHTHFETRESNAGPHASISWSQHVPPDTSCGE